MEKIKSFKDLRILQKGVEIVKDVYTLTKTFPKEEVYGITGQMRRAAVSLPINVAEGFKRFHRKEYQQFLHITLGSAAELETLLILSAELGYASPESLQQLQEKLDHLSKMVSSLLGKLHS